MEQHSLSFQYSARYFTLGSLNSDTKAIWFVLHGYGQLAEYFIKKFQVLANYNIYVIAPEGLSRFYLEQIDPKTGRANDRVGATWMTKENRLMDIENYINYLSGIYKKEVGTSSVPVTILGFSQGAATASRWLLSNQIRFNRLVLWAGVFPSDMNFVSGKKTFEEKEVTFVYGTADPFLTDKKFNEMQKLASEISASINEIAFEGGHEIDRATLLKLIQPYD